ATLSESTASCAPRSRRWLTFARSVVIGVRLWNVTSSMPRYLRKSVKRPISGSPIVPVPTIWTIFFMENAPLSGRPSAEAPEGYDEKGNSPTRGERGVAGRLHSVVFAGPAGRLEGLWREPDGPPRGAAVFAHPHPLGGGTMHNKVAYRAAQELARAGYSAL